ncbi:Retrovirus-related Pol polyprotein from transposon TNT 1-94 [Senna tora]|uniref:Retrovirus-related Pol polyprotein from transposon TNT 1-94 n=1 Tax=Senna tora TaxID=362788 RepID=A0A834SY76_9FABA|nr:Retrovirus-related Pol polyprotein from transposon TNT 1-94 [Senna tora]
MGTFQQMPQLKNLHWEMYLTLPHLLNTPFARVFYPIKAWETLVDEIGTQQEWTQDWALKMLEAQLYSITSPEVQALMSALKRNGLLLLGTAVLDYTVNCKLSRWQDINSPQSGADSNSSCASSDSVGLSHSVYPIHMDPLNFLAWNARGASSPSFRRIFTDLKNQYQPNLVLISETRVGEDRVAKIIPTLGFSNFFRVDPMGFAGGIWLLWDRDQIAMKIHEYTFQEIHTTVEVTNGRAASYLPQSRLSNRKITIADGSATTVAGLGNVCLNDHITLKDVLDVPKLCTNLISVHKLSTDSQCSAIFHPTHCVFQEQGMKRMIGHAKERNGLYYLETCPPIINSALQPQQPSDPPPISPDPDPNLQTNQTLDSARPLQVYSRRKVPNPTSEPVQSSSSEPQDVEVIDSSNSHTHDYDVPIALRKVYDFNPLTPLDLFPLPIDKKTSIDEKKKVEIVKQLHEHVKQQN